ncbi:MAG TPA: WYL domain-containing transcriptional regulator [Phycisphaerae bacterium]|nr:WYL domain-containing transcriptional regulator [Phycisphaerae bacterium]
MIKLLQMLQSGRRYDADGLADGLTVSRRTLFRDLKMLEAAGIPFQYDKKSKQYQINKDYFLPPINLTVGEALALMLLTRRVSTRKFHPEYRQALEAAQKIEAAIPGRIRSHCGAILQNIHVRFWPTSDVDGIDDVNATLMKALVESRKVLMRYDSFYDGCVIEDVIHPYKRIFMNRGWYMIGFSEKEGATRTYKLERIEQLTLGEQLFEPDPDFSLENYFGCAWQMIRGDRRYHVVIRFTPKVAGNVEEVLWHRSQRVQRDADGSLLFEVDVDGLGEISWWIMGYGDQALVLEPPELRDLIVKRARSLVAGYDDTTNVDG